MKITGTVVLFFISMSLLQAQMPGCPLFKGIAAIPDWEHFPIGTSIDGVIISSPVSDTVRSIAEGRVTDIMEGRTMVFIQRSDSTLFWYFDLARVNLHSGDRVKKGTIIGKAKKSQTGFEMRVEVYPARNSKKKEYKKHIGCPFTPWSKF